MKNIKNRIAIISLCLIGLIIGITYAIVMAMQNWVYGAIAVPLFILGFYGLKPILVPTIKMTYYQWIINKYERIFGYQLFNVNHYIHVKLTENGRKIYIESGVNLSKKVGFTDEVYFQEQRELAEKVLDSYTDPVTGYTKFQMHVFMDYFGGYDHNTKGGSPYSTNIIIETKTPISKTMAKAIKLLEKN